MSHYINVLKKYAQFKGRSSRAEFWFYFLFNFIASFAFSFALTLAHIPQYAVIYFFATIIPGIAVTVRRVHDTGRSGWFSLIPVYGWILLLTKGTEGVNAYGADPYGTVQAVVKPPLPNIVKNVA